MKKFIVIIALMLSATSAIAGPKFGHWLVNDDATLIANNYTADDGSIHTVGIHDNGKSYLSYNIPNSPYTEIGSLVREHNVIIQVNGKNVRYLVKTYSSGFMSASPESKEGNDWVLRQLWNKREVMFDLRDGNWSRFSAQGVQKAWRYMRDNFAI